MGVSVPAPPGPGTWHGRLTGGAIVHVLAVNWPTHLVSSPRSPEGRTGDEHFRIGGVSRGEHIPKGTGEGLPVLGVAGPLGPGGTGSSLDGRARLPWGERRAQPSHEMGD